jgi:hypothetical protein
VLAILVAATVSTASAADLGAALNAKLKGAWGVSEVEVFSSCSGSYNNNTLGEMGVASKASRRFTPGEIIKIDRVKVRRQRVDLMLTLAETVRVARSDGPFTLYDERTCKVQLMVPVPREEIKAGRVEAVLDRISAPLALFTSLDEARSSELWNGREPQPLPEDYDRTLQRHAAWKAEQTNREVREKSRTALARAADLAERLRDDEDYLAGFSAGAEKMSSLYLTDCSPLLSASDSANRSSPPGGKDSRWKEGWEDGQDLIFNLLVAQRLQACMVPVPAVDPP